MKNAPKFGKRPYDHTAAEQVCRNPKSSKVEDTQIEHEEHIRLLESRLMGVTEENDYLKRDNSL